MSVQTRKAGLYLLAIILMLAAAQPGLAAPGWMPFNQGAGVEVSIPDLSAEASGAVTVPITALLGANDLYAADIVITYDPAVIQPTAVEKGALIENFSIASNLSQSGVIRIGVSGAAPANGDGILLEIQFDVVGSAGTASALSWQRCDLNEGALPATTSDGSISVVSSLDSFDLSLVAGWNLASFPIIPSNPSVSAITAGTESSFNAIYAYDAIDAGDHWKTYYLGAGGDLTTLDHTQGFWVHATEPYTLTVQGTLPITTVIPLIAGWNLVGYPSATTRPVQVATAGIAANLVAVYAYDVATDSWERYRPGAPSYVNTLAEMEAGIGYWIKVDLDCTWMVTY